LNLINIDQCWSVVNHGSRPGGGWGARGPAGAGGLAVRRGLNRIRGDDESPDQYHLAIDDGVRARAWDLVVEDSVYRQATPGALVHARVRGWRGGQASVWLVEPAAVARQLADPGVAWDPRGHEAPGPAGTTAGGPG
jgi:hypothetical protein